MNKKIIGAIEDLNVIEYSARISTKKLAWKTKDSGG